MSIDDGSGAPRNRWRRPSFLLILAGALALPIVAVVVTRVHLGGSVGLTDGLRRDLAAQVETILETSSVIARIGEADHDHGHGPVRVLCAVDPFGIDPADARDAAAVRWVYAQHLCAIATAGTPWEAATKSAGPVAVSLGNPPEVRLPQPPRDYRTQVREMIPARYLAQAFGTFAHPDVITALRKRYADEVAKAAATP